MLGLERSKACYRFITFLDAIGRFDGKGKLALLRRLHNSEDEAILAALQNFSTTSILEKTNTQKMAEGVKALPYTFR